MQKQTKTLKFMLAVLILIPIVLLLIGIVQTFVLKSKQNELYNAKYELAQSNNTKQEKENEFEYKSSEEYLKESFRHNDGYGNDGDIELK